MSEHRFGQQDPHCFERLPLTFVDGAATAIIDYGWTLKETRSTYVTGDNGYSFVTAEFTTTGGANTINFGVQDIINSLTTKSISIWFFAAPTGGGYLLSTNRH